MSVAQYPMTTSTTLQRIYRKVSSALMQGLNFASEEWGMVGSLKQFKVDVNTREVLVPLDINEAAGVASINEAGWEANPSTPNVEELSLTYILLNKRFIQSDVQRILDAKQSKAEVINSLTYSGKKALEALAADFSDKFYGSTSAILAQPQATIATASAGDVVSVPLTNAYGSSAYPGGASTTVGGAYVKQLFKPLDRIAFFASNATASSTALGYAEVVATNVADVSGFSAISVRWLTAVGSTIPTTATIVKANAVQASVANPIASDTDWGKGLSGISAILGSGSLHNVSAAQVAEWRAPVDASGGRITGTRLRAATDTIANRSGKKADMAIISQGVYRDFVANSMGALRYTDSPTAMETIGDVKAGSLKWHSTRRVPPGMLTMFNSECLQKLDVSDRPTAPGAADLRRLTDRAAFVGGLDLHTQVVCPCRAGFFGFTGLTEQ